MSCNHLSDCLRCGGIVDDFEERCLSAEAKVERLEDEIKAERLALKRALSKRNPYPVEWNKDGNPPRTRCYNEKESEKWVVKESVVILTEVNFMPHERR